jgi:acetylornithine deacetylase/succinyl-diaminopimelate desuccinylase-like protein
MEQLFNAVEARAQKSMQELFELLRCKSISAQDDGVAACAELLAGYLERAGVSATVYQTPRHPIVYGELRAGEHMPTLLIYGHYDVQPPEPLELWNSDPFEPVIRDGKIYARGASDNKSQLFAHIKGVEAYLACYKTLPVNIKFLLEGEEEIGSPSLKPFVLEHKDLLACDFAVVSDSHVHESGSPTIILGLKGMLYIEITLRGARQDFHSMKAAAIANPIWRMAHLLACMRDADGSIMIEGFYDTVRPLLPAELATVAQIPYDKEAVLSSHGVGELLSGRITDHYYHNMAFEPTCNVAGIFGGYTGEGSKTVLPCAVTAKLDMRLVPNQQPEDILNKVKAHLAKNGFADAEVKTLGGTFVPSRTPVDSPYVALARRAVAAAWGEEPIIYPGIGGAGPNYIFTDLLGVDCAVIPFAASDQNNHAPNESMTVSGFYNGIKTSAALIRQFAKGAPDNE